MYCSTDTYEINHGREALWVPNNCMQNNFWYTSLWPFWPISTRLYGVMSWRHMASQHDVMMLYAVIWCILSVFMSMYVHVCQSIMTKGLSDKRTVHEGNAGGTWMLRRFHCCRWQFAGLLSICQLMWCLLRVVHPASVNVTLIPIESHCKICNNYCRITHLFLLGYRSAGFLAYLSADVIAPSGFDPILFDVEEYDYGNNYNPSTGKCTVPLDRLYLRPGSRSPHSDTGHEKTDLKVFAVAIPKEGWGILLLVCHRLLENTIYEVKRFKF